MTSASSRADRLENARRAAEVACLFADAGMVAIVALISPYAESRRRARQIHERAGLAFVEVYMDASVDLCTTRDPKGLYARASTGEIRSFTGVDDPYEVPEAPDLVDRVGHRPGRGRRRRGAGARAGRGGAATVSVVPALCVGVKGSLRNNHGVSAFDLSLQPKV